MSWLTARLLAYIYSGLVDIMVVCWKDPVSNPYLVRTCRGKINEYVRIRCFGAQLISLLEKLCVIRIYLFCKMYNSDIQDSHLEHSWSGINNLHSVK